MDIYRFSVEPNVSDMAEYLDKRVKVGQKVKLTRMVTIDYIVDVSDILDGTDEKDILLVDLIQDELDNVGYAQISDIWDEAEDVDEVVISYEIL